MLEHPTRSFAVRCIPAACQSHSPLVAVACLRPSRCADMRLVPLLLLFPGTTTADIPAAAAQPARARRETGEIPDTTATVFKTNHTICHMGLWADKEFVDHYGGADSAVVKMLQRFSTVRESNLNQPLLHPSSSSRAPSLDGRLSLSGFLCYIC